MPARSRSGSTARLATLPAAAKQPGGRLIAVEIDQASLAPNRSFIDRERAIAVSDLVAENVFRPVGRSGEAYRLSLSTRDKKLVLDIADADEAPIIRHVLSLTPLRPVIKDYFLVCDSFYALADSAQASQIEAIDMGRRGLHNQGAGILRDRLAGKIEIDFPTARRLFTLVCSLHWKG
jgi:uncharacterized protein (UPF0262 family)